MKPDRLLEELEAVAGRLSVKVSYETLTTSLGGGGLCRVKGRYRIIVDKRASTRERIATIAMSLASFDTSALTVPATVRELIDYYVLRRAS